MSQTGTNFQYTQLFLGEGEGNSWNYKPTDHVVPRQIINPIPVYHSLVSLRISNHHILVISYIYDW